jgi:hypothetical protein
LVLSGGRDRGLPTKLLIRPQADEQFLLTAFLNIKFNVMNIIETVQKSLGFDVLKKIDPNTQETVGDETAMGNSAIAQAGIPAILLGIFNKLEENPEANFLDIKGGNVLEKIFGKSSAALVSKIDHYSKFQDKHSAQQLEHIAAESMRVVREGIGQKTDEKSIRGYVAKNKPDILLYLPPSLDLGTILKNNNLDDRTAKMEGPFSTFMRNVEKAFNSSSKN